jgi:hypothetical protein
MDAALQDIKKEIRFAKPESMMSTAVHRRTTNKERMAKKRKANTDQGRRQPIIKPGKKDEGKGMR